MYKGKVSVRPYTPEYRDQLRAVHMATASEHARSDETHGRFSLLMYCDEYLEHETVLMLVDENDHACGYIMCAEDYASWRKHMIPYAEEIQKLGEPYAHRPYDAFRDYEAASSEYPAHLHIDILEEYTGNHHGTMLMEALIDHLKQKSVKGVCLGVAKANERAFGFYTKMGFRVLASDEGGAFMGLKL